jgi:hypothetical protein
MNNREDRGAAREWLVQTTQRLHDLQRAVRAGEFRVHESQRHLIEQVMSLSLAPGELIDPDRLSAEAVGLVRTGAMALKFTSDSSGKSTGPTIDRADGQRDLFGLFEEAFAAITGRTYDAFPSEIELAAAARDRATNEPSAMTRSFERAIERLGAFYQAHAHALWAHAQEIGGLKLVLGGQRMFGPSALGGVRKMALYADTQLVPDPVFPFFEKRLDLKTQFVDLLRQLYYVLELSPLVKARLPVPPVVVFPSFEKLLEDRDVQTQVGIFELVGQTVGAACGVELKSVGDVTDFVRAEPDRFVEGVMREQLFLPPGVAPGEITDARAAVGRYLAELAEYRTGESVQRLEKLPLAAQLLTGIAERFGPQYHLLENARELGAQPMLTQKSHWHYFQKASGAAALELHRKDILSAESMQVLQALQDQRLAWLANVPVPILAELLANQENLAFRKEMSDHVKTLSGAGPAELDRVVREVCHGIETMVQKHQKTIREIEAKYAGKYSVTWLTGGTGTALGAAAMFLPMLSALGPVAPLAAAAGLAGKLAIDKLNEVQEVRLARSSLLGVLAATPRT